MTPAPPTTARGRATTIIALGALVALGPFTIDLYLPAFPALALDLATSETAVQLTLTGTIVGFALGQLLIGPWSDAVGRRLPMLATIALHLAASLTCAVAPTIEVLATARILQGIGAAGGGVVAMAMVRDMFAGRAMVVVLSRMALVSGLAPVVAPLIGSQLLLVTNWRGLFVALICYGVAVMVSSVLILPETRPREVRAADTRGASLRRYRVLLTDRRFVGIVVMGGFNFSGLFAYLSSSTFLFQDVYGFSQQAYGLLFAVNSVAVVIGTQTTGQLSRRFAPQWILSASTTLMIVASATMVVLHFTGAGIWGVVIPLWFFILGIGLSFPCLQVLALADHPAEAGTAASLLGAVNFGSAGVVPPIIGALGSATALPMSAVMLCCAVASSTMLWLVVRPRSVPALVD